MPLRGTCDEGEKEEDNVFVPLCCGDCFVVARSRLRPREERKGSATVVLIINACRYCKPTFSYRLIREGKYFLSSLFEEKQQRLINGTFTYISLRSFLSVEIVVKLKQRGEFETGGERKKR